MIAGRKSSSRRTSRSTEGRLLFLPLFADRVVEVHRRKIVGDELADLRRTGFLRAARVKLGQAIAKAEFLLQRRGARRERYLVRRGFGRYDRDRLAQARRIQMYARKYRT